jgi:hypothetical protein
MKTKVLRREKLVEQATQLPFSFLIDALGSIRDEIKKLEAEEEKIRKKLDNLGEGQYDGKKYTLNITQNTLISEVDKASLLKKLGPQKFLEVVSVSIEKLREYVAPKDIEEVTKATKTIKRFSVKEKKNDSR